MCTIRNPVRYALFEEEEDKDAEKEEREESEELEIPQGERWGSAQAFKFRLEVSAAGSKVAHRTNVLQSVGCNRKAPFCVN